MKEIVKELKIELQDEEWSYEYTDHDRNIVRAVVVDDEGYYYFAHLVRDDIFCTGEIIETSGGGVEGEEDLHSAILRELKEELGVEAEIVCKLGVVSDYYNLIHRHNVNNYYLCKVVSFGSNHLSKDEEESFHLTTLKLTFKQALEEYERCKCTKLGRVVANRELPILRYANEVLNGKQ